MIGGRRSIHIHPYRLALIHPKITHKTQYLETNRHAHTTPPSYGRTANRCLAGRSTNPHNDDDDIDTIPTISLRRPAAARIPANSWGTTDWATAISYSAPQSHSAQRHRTCDSCVMGTRIGFGWWIDAGKVILAFSITARTHRALGFRSNS